MKTNRRLMLICGAVLICTAVAVLLVFTASANPETNIPAYTGRGDYQRYEAQFFPAESEAQPGSSYVGMGDLRSLEWQQSNPAASNYVGMGDLRSFEATQASK